MPLPDKLELFPNYPNPFNSGTTFRFSMNRSGYARLLLFDISGRMAACVFERSFECGTYSFNWQATDLSSGVYLAILQTRDASSRQYITLIK
ncbi:MAG: T9SS type A sorting domain-containing protein [Candidatus Neomarinimicrobiota bacterium]